MAAAPMTVAPADQTPRVHFVYRPVTPYGIEGAFFYVRLDAIIR